MTQGRLADAEPRVCVICGTRFTPARRKQEACPASTGRTCAITLSNQKRSGTRSAAGKFDKPGERLCDRCERPYQPARFDSRTCGADCPGRPDEIRVCANPDCALRTPVVTRVVDGRELRPGEYIVKGGNRGKASQRYCSKKCRDHVARIRQGQRFRRYDGLTREEFTSAGEERGWRCDICGQVPLPDSRRIMLDELPYLVVDHCHRSGERRGLLCGPCNTAIGLLADDPDRAAAAAAYLRLWQTPAAASPRAV